MYQLLNITPQTQKPQIHMVDEIHILNFYNTVMQDIRLCYRNQF